MGGAHLRPLQEFAAAAGQGDLAVDHDEAAMGELERVIGVLFDQEYREPVAGVERSDDVEDLPRDQRREAERRLVEQQEPRPPHQGARDGEHLLLAARQRAAALAEPLGEAWEQFEDAGEVAVPGVGAGRKRAHLQVLQHAHARKDAPAFRGLGDVKPGDFVGRQLRNVAAGEFDAALAGARLAEDGHHQGRLAGAVGPDQGDDLALRDVEIDALERDDVAIIGLDPAQAEESGHGAPPRAAAARRSCSGAV